MATLDVDRHTLQMKPASEFFSSLMVMEMYEDLTTRLDAHNVKLNLLQSSILELTKVVKLLVASEVKKNPTGYGDDNKTTMYEEDDVSFFYLFLHILDIKLPSHILHHLITITARVVTTLLLVFGIIHFGTLLTYVSPSDGFSGLFPFI